jgi:hypothetical protein
MFSNEQHFNPRRPQDDQPGPERGIHETTLLRHGIQIERKEFSLALKENPRGRFIRVVEHNGNVFLLPLLFPLAAWQTFAIFWTK